MASAIERFYKTTDGATEADIEVVVSAKKAESKKDDDQTLPVVD